MEREFKITIQIGVKESEYSEFDLEEYITDLIGPSTTEWAESAGLPELTVEILGAELDSGSIIDEVGWSFDTNSDDEEDPLEI